MFFAAQIMTQVIGFFFGSQFGSRLATVALIAELMAAISNLHHRLATGSCLIASGVDLTFATCQPRVRNANVKSKTPLETHIASGPLILKMTTPAGCKC